MSVPVSLLITHVHLLTMAGEGVGYVRDGAVAIDGGRIISTGTSDALLQQFGAEIFVADLRELASEIRSNGGSRSQRHHNIWRLCLAHG